MTGNSKRQSASPRHCPDRPARRAFGLGAKKSAPDVASATPLAYTQNRGLPSRAGISLTYRATADRAQAVIAAYGAGLVTPGSTPDARSAVSRQADQA
jgi:hypothetical protein